MLEFVFLVVGLLILTVAIAAVLRGRAASKKARPAVTSGLLEPESPLIPSDSLRPGMVNALTGGEVNARDIRLTLLDLAVRGCLLITPVKTAAGQDSWQLHPASWPDQAALFDYERILLEDSFAHGAETLAELTSDPAKPLRRAQNALKEYTDAQHWFSTDPRRRHSKLGWIGALITVVGLLVVASMFIDWAATKDFRGVIGGLAIAAAGMLIASQGRARNPHTHEGLLARTEVEQLSSTLKALRPEEIAVASAGAEFSRLLPWAIGLGAETQLAKAVDDQLRRAATWGQQVDLQLHWFVPQADFPSVDVAQQITGELATVVNRKPNGNRPAHQVVGHG